MAAEAAVDDFVEAGPGVVVVDDFVFGNPGAAAAAAAVAVAVVAYADASVVVVAVAVAAAFVLVSVELTPHGGSVRQPPSVLGGVVVASAVDFA